MKAYPKYTWIGSKITSENMAKLYHLKQTTKKTDNILSGRGHK